MARLSADMPEHGRVAIASVSAGPRPPALSSPLASAQQHNRYGSLQLNLHQRAGSGSSSESLYESVREQASPCDNVDAPATLTPTPQPATTPSAFHARRQALRWSAIPFRSFFASPSHTISVCETICATPCRQEEIAQDLLEAYTAEYGGAAGELHLQPCMEKFACIVRFSQEIMRT